MEEKIDTSQLPQRLRESTFRVFELDIAHIVEKWPEPTYLQPKLKGYTALSFSDRLRGSMQSLAKYRWRTSSINMEKFLRIYPEMIVSHKETRIIVAPRAFLRETDSQGVALAVDRTAILHGAKIFDQTIQITDDKEVKLICLLVHNKLLNRPIKVSGITPSTAIWIEDNYDARVEANADGTFTIL